MFGAPAFHARILRIRKSDVAGTTSVSAVHKSVDDHLRQDFPHHLHLAPRRCTAGIFLRRRKRGSCFSFPTRLLVQCTAGGRRRSCVACDRLLLAPEELHLLLFSKEALFYFPAADSFSSKSLFSRTQSRKKRQDFPLRSSA